MAISVIANKKYFIKSYAKSGSTGQYLNIWGTSFTGNMQHVKTYTKVASDPMQKWFFGENPETGCFIRTECNSAYAINMNSVANPICTMYTAVGNDTDAKVKLIPVNDSKRVYYIYLVNRKLYLTATGEATGSACKWQAKNSSDLELQQWQFEPVDGATPPTPETNLIDGEKPVDVNFNGSSYNSPTNPFSPNYNWQCTWYAWGRTKEKTGFSIDFGNVTSGRGAGKWYGVVKNLTQKAVPSIGDRGIIEWINPSGGDGHVAFLEKYDGTYCWFTQANKTGDGVKSSDDGVVSKRTLEQVRAYCSGLGYSLGKFLIV